ncbi:MAG: DNA-directed RNA polymerase subunit A' [Thermoplasmata archaeon]
MILGIRKRIKAIKFAFLSPNEIRAMSATKIITADTYDDDGFPIEMGLMDPRLGVVEPGLRCKTCGRKVDECPGHFGHIDLAMPVIHVGYVKEIKRLLKSTCRQCGRLLHKPLELPPAEPVEEALEISPEEKAGEEGGPLEGLREEERDAVQVRICPHCGAEQVRITLDKPTSFREGGHKLTPKEVRERLERIPNEDLPALGLNPEVVRPEWMVLTALPVPPVTVRPSITLESGDRSEDDLTHKLVDVLRINQRLRENRDAGAPQLIVEDLWELLQYHVTTYFDNQTSGIPPARHRSGRPLKTLAQRLKGKEGRFRSNLSGKRVNFSARTVISPDPLLSINEVGIPMEVAMELTVPIRVTSWNMEVVKGLVLRGSKNYPGVNYVIRPDGRRIKVTDKNAQNLAETLEEGFIVERHLVDGDIVLFNRQPSLHRMSIMAHEVRVMPQKTFRLNLSVCPPYNADFDGDEMNLHALQSEEARAEARILMKVQEHILSPRFGGPVIGAIHDHITGAFMLTHGEQRFNKDETLYLLSFIDVGMELPKPAGKDRNGEPYWTGKQIASLVIPSKLNLEYRASICAGCEECKKERCMEETGFDAYTVIENGVLKHGVIDEKGIGAFKGKILDKIVRDYGPDEGRIFIDNITKLAIATIMLKGFTTGLSDEDIPPEARRQIDEILEKARADVEERVEAFRQGLLEQMPGRSLEETLEVDVMKLLGRARDQAGNIASKYLGLENSAVIMAKSGARGSMLNLSQMAGCIGQQAVRGERIHRGYQSRTLPHFRPGDLGAEAMGFVSSSYKNGLKPTEFFFHCMGGREGLVDTAVRTSRSGYMQRRLINALEDLKVTYDGTVRNTSGTIIQFKYGEDGVDPTRSVRGDAVDVDDIIREVLGVAAGEEEEKKGAGFRYGEYEADLVSTQEEFETEEETSEDDFGGD